MGDYDEDTAFLGQTGPYFWTTFFLLNMVFVPTGFNGLYIVFVGAMPKHHCLIPDINLTEEWRNAIIPISIVGGEEVQSQCSRYKVEVVQNLSAEGYIPGRDVNLTSLEQEGCLDGWNYSKEIYQSNIVTEVSKRMWICWWRFEKGLILFFFTVGPCLQQPVESSFCLLNSFCGISLWVADLWAVLWQVFCHHIIIETQCNMKHYYTNRSGKIFSKKSIFFCISLQVVSMETECKLPWLKWPFVLEAAHKSRRCSFQAHKRDNFGYFQRGKHAALWLRPLFAEKQGAQDTVVWSTRVL